MTAIKLNFDELPLIVEDGFEAGLVNGTAAISYHADNEWCVTGISLDGARLRTIAERTAGGGVFERKPVALESTGWLYLAILHQLENGRFKSFVEDAIDADRAASADDAADQRREARNEHSTLNRAQQGC